ncbi:MAG: hypothetical protein R3313_00495 [Candidatus Saccharimonadales bacterium]|nr:hypothetical protein [Candidatus Saccharimonadales bacterium]
MIRTYECTITFQVASSATRDAALDELDVVGGTIHDAMCEVAVLLEARINGEVSDQTGAIYQVQIAHVDDNTSISVLNISPQAEGKLVYAGINTIGDLAGLTQEQIRVRCNFMQIELEELVAALDEWSRSLHEATE